MKLAEDHLGEYVFEVRHDVLHKGPGGGKRR